MNRKSEHGLGNPYGIMMGDSVLKVSPDSISDPGPKNPAASSQAPSSEIPPSTDRGSVPNFWFPFARAHKRVQEGGWARQVTVRDLPIATEIAGVNMRLLSGAIREMHWHQASEWAYMLYGNARITCVDPQGRIYINDVKEGDLWFFPSGYPHSIQGLGPDGCEFLLAFDDGMFSEEETFLITDWMAHTPADVLAKNFTLPESSFKNIPEHELYIFPGQAAKSLKEDKDYVGPLGSVPNPFSYSLLDQKPDATSKSGSARIADSSKFKAANAITGALVTVKPGGMREMHWHPNADEWLYVISGSARVNVFAAVGNSRTMDFDPGDVGYVPKAMGHYVENRGDTDLRFLEIFKSSYYASISLGEWMGLTPPELVEQHTNMSLKDIESISKIQQVIVPN